jgi:cytosine/adenosine deaminase-related metal-dependent hydrolase
VVDGTGAARFAADVLIRDGRIAEIAPHLPPVGEVIDARGMIVCPGFIDGSIWVPGSYVSKSSSKAPHNAFPRRLTLCTHSKKPK